MIWKATHCDELRVFLRNGNLFQTNCNKSDSTKSRLRKHSKLWTIIFHRTESTLPPMSGGGGGGETTVTEAPIRNPLANQIPINIMDN